MFSFIFIVIFLGKYPVSIMFHKIGWLVVLGLAILSVLFQYISSREEEEKYEPGDKKCPKHKTKKNCKHSRPLPFNYPN